jgi:hypothetical protein
LRRRRLLLLQHGLGVPHNDDADRLWRELHAIMLTQFLGGLRSTRPR